jgi:DNA-binding GntR family transcriptional regulator
MDDTFFGIEHKTLAERVLEQLMAWVMDGAIQMGEKLNTEALAQKLTVSRMPIREAIKDLETKGLVESVPYAGARLVTLTEDDIRQIYIMRRALEPLAGYYACLNATSSDIDHIALIMEEYTAMLRSPAVTALQVYDGNRLFHFSIYKASYMDRICRAIEQLWDNLTFFKLNYGKIYVVDEEARNNAIADHQSYFSLLQQRNAQGLHDKLDVNLERLVHKMPEFFLQDLSGAALGTANWRAD